MRSITFKAAWVAAAAALVLSAGPRLAEADTTIDTMASWDGHSSIADFGVPNTETYGQTFTTPAENYLNSYSFNLTPYGGGTSGTFDFYLAAWDGSKVTGPILYQTGPLAMPSGQGFTTYTVSPDVRLTSGQQYVAFISTSQQMQVTDIAAQGGMWNDPYAGGGFVWENNGTDTSQWYNTAWTNTSAGGGVWYTFDTAFKADFTAASAPVPEGNTLAMLATGGLPVLLGLGSKFRRRRTA